MKVPAFPANSSLRQLVVLYSHKLSDKKPQMPLVLIHPATHHYPYLVAQ